MSLEVIICTRDRPAELARCLGSLAAQTAPAEAVTVIDAGALALDPGPLRLKPRIVASAPGLPRQRNIGLAAATSDLITFLDDDVELDPGYLAAVRGWFAEHEQAAGVTGNIVNARRRSAAARAYRRLFALADDDGRLQSSGDACFLHHPSRPTRVDYLSGSNMTFRHRLVADLRFDERLEGYAYMEDVDFSLRVLPRGELWALPEARLVHHETTTARVPQSEYVEQVLGNARYLFEKHRAQYGLSRAAFARRYVGRCLAYLALAISRRSREPAAGVVRALRAAPPAPLDRAPKTRW